MKLVFLIFSSQKHVFFTKNLLLTGFGTKTSLKEKKNDKWKQHEDSIIPIRINIQTNTISAKFVK